MNGNTLAWSGLPRNRDIALDRNRRLDIDNAAYVKNDNAVPLAHRIPERADSIVIQIRHMINSSATTAGNIRTKPKCFRKRERFGTGPRKTRKR